MQENQFKNQQIGKFPWNHFLEFLEELTKTLTVIKNHIKDRIRWSSPFFIMSKPDILPIFLYKNYLNKNTLFFLKMWLCTF